jgi:hypothetical protein
MNHRALDIGQRSSSEEKIKEDILEAKDEAMNQLAYGLVSLKLPRENRPEDMNKT